MAPGDMRVEAVTWTRADLSRLLLEEGRNACDNYEPNRHGDCTHCGDGLLAHLAKHAAEEIGVLDAQVHRLKIKAGEL